MTWWHRWHRYWETGWDTVGKGEVVALPEATALCLGVSPTGVPPHPEGGDTLFLYFKVYFVILGGGGIWGQGRPLPPVLIKDDGGEWLGGVCVGHCGGGWPSLGGLGDIGLSWGCPCSPPPTKSAACGQA